VLREPLASLLCLSQDVFARSKDDLLVWSFADSFQKPKQSGAFVTLGFSGECGFAEEVVKVEQLWH
jgi:hypothetical protein